MRRSRKASGRPNGHSAETFRASEARAVASVAAEREEEEEEVEAAAAIKPVVSDDSSTIVQWLLAQSMPSIWMGRGKESSTPEA